PEDIQFAFGERLLIELAAFGGRGDGIEHAGIGDAGLGVIRNELVAVRSDPDPRITRLQCHGAALRAHPRARLEKENPRVYVLGSGSCGDSSPFVGWIAYSISASNASSMRIREPAAYGGP